MPSRTFLLFLLTGGFAAVVNWSSRILYNMWMPFSYAIVAAYVTGMVTAFLLAKIFVFTASTQSVARSAIIFTAVNIAAVFQTWAVSVLLAYHVLPSLGAISHAKEIAHLCGVIVPVLTSYIGHKKYSFR